MKNPFEKTNQYIWARYIDNSRDHGQVDEDEALKLFEEHYSKHALNEDPDCFFYGILMYEASFRHEERRIQFLKRARDVFNIYRETSGEREWEVIEDRLEDINSTLAAEGVSEAEEEAPRQGPIIAEEGMVLVPAGKFLKGPKREEKFLEAFMMDIHPVTNAQYKRFVEATNYRPPVTWDDERFAQPDQPVTGISFMDVQKFCHWSGKHLPTEDQWEKAARGSDGRLYPWGEGIDPSKTSYRKSEDDEGRLDPIDRYDVNVSPLGCREMVGYVWEWTVSMHEAEPEARVVKGGSWVDSAEDPDFLSCYARLWAPVKEKNELLGFRCCKRLGE